MSELGAEAAERTIVVNCKNQVRIWVSEDGLPPKHVARLARLRAMEPDANIVLLVADEYLSPSGREGLSSVARALGLQLLDIRSLCPVGDDERLILEHLYAEARSFFSDDPLSKGNLSVVSDLARLLTPVLELGLCTDMDVEFMRPLGANAASIGTPVDLIARYKLSGGLSNDVTAASPASAVMRIARRNAAAMIERYQAAAREYLRQRGEDMQAGVGAIAYHPRYLELRNKRPRGTLSGQSRFGLAIGPDNFAISAHEIGISSGYEQIVRPSDEPGELDPGHAPMVLDDLSDDGTRLEYSRHKFDEASPGVPSARREIVWPGELPPVISHWDHSWVHGNEGWKTLNYRELLISRNVSQGEWSIDRARAVLGRWDTPPGCGADLDTVVPRNWPEREAATRPRFSSVARVGVPSEAAHHRLGVRHPQGTTASDALAADGVVSLVELIEGTTLERIRECFSLEVKRKASSSLLELGSFNVSVDDCMQVTLSAVRDLADDPTLLGVMSEYVGGPVNLVSARGYRQGPCRPLRYRAWDYHQDMKTHGPREEVKAMILLTDVTKDGQALRYICGSHRHRWSCASQQQTKFSLDEALSWGEEDRLFVGHGAAGTVILFDTNGIHAGHRNYSATRDVLTLNFCPRQGSGMFLMFSDAMFPVRRIEVSDQSVPTPSPEVKWRSDVLDASALEALRAEYARTPALADVRPRWSGDALDFVDVAISDLNSDLDLRISSEFREDRDRDIALVKLRDASIEDVRFTRLVVDQVPHSSQLMDAPSSIAPPEAPHRAPCAWLSGDLALATERIVAAVRKVRACLEEGTSSEAAALAALLADLEDSLPRSDSIPRMRTNLAFMYFATSAASELVVGAASGDAAQVRHLVLHAYRDLVWWDDGLAKQLTDREPPEEVDNLV